MRCYGCNLVNEPVVAFINVKIQNIFDNKDTGAKVFMCRICINKIFNKMGVNINQLMKEVK